MAEIFTGWQNRNENRNYPVHDRATRLSASGILLPNDILADAHLALPQSAGKFIFISSIGISTHLVSLTFLATADDPINGGALGAFVPLGTITVQKPVTIYRNYPVTAIYAGFGGWLSFGAGVADIEELALRFTDPMASVLAARAVFAYSDMPVTALGNTISDARLTGLVKLYGQEGLITVQKAVRTISGVNREVITVGLDTDAAADPTQLLVDYAGPCGRPEQRTCPEGKAILTINGVEPDCTGNIRIRVEGLDATITGITAEQAGNTVASGNIIDVPVGLEDICPIIDPSRIFDADLCEPSSSSVSSSSSSSESGLSSSSSSPMASEDEYCDDFEDPGYTFANLTARSGTWAIAQVIRGSSTTNRLISGRGLIGPQVIMNEHLYKSADGDGYTVACTIKARTENGNGHVIFGYKNIDDFWFAGFSLRAASDVGGLLYVGRKTARHATILDNWPNGLDYGYFFTADILPNEDYGAGGAGGGEPPPFGAAGLFNTDIRVNVSVTPLTPGSSIHLVQVSYAWDQGHDFLDPSVSSFANIVFTVSPSDSDMYGYAGLGTVGSETEFDDFGIECDDWTP